ncbi:MAG: transcription termination factor Rho [Candidatus Aminicenantes bacterium]|nr:transcription termination factor Rho [Candidatus Aminicenantes bacterium]
MKRHKKKAILVDPEYFLDHDEKKIFVPEQLVQSYKLSVGAQVSGPVRRGKQGLILQGVEKICGLSPRDFAGRQPYTRLTALPPDERFNLGITGEPAMRIVDLMAPIAKGTRGLIVSPPRAGKTILLEQIAASIHASDPETRIIVLLVDERPEEVTHFRRQVKAEVLASSNDQDTKQHIALTEFVMGHVTMELECGRDVVVLVDSLTRISRAFNQRKAAPNMRGRIMSGGIQAGALEVPRRFFGMARNIENGGSLTIIATVLVDTGSRMDQHIFEEFKGTGNCEIILDRDLADARVFPAINIPASGTRKEELLYTPAEVLQINKLRRAIAGIGKNKEAMELLLKFLKRNPANSDYLLAAS